MNNAHPMLAPVIALVLWTAVMWTWMYVTRIPAIARMKMRLDPTRPRGEQMNALPAEVRWKADNYNHLMEQPTLFYAVALTLAVVGGAAGVDVALAWAYVALRVVHSLVQATINFVPARFVIFMVASLALLVLAVRAAILVF
jgi:hypothetical protein